MDLINYCLRIVINHYQEPFDLNHKKPFFDKYSQISIEKLITSRTTDQLVENLKGTEYYEPLKKLKDSQSVTCLITICVEPLLFYRHVERAQKVSEEKRTGAFHQRLWLQD